MSSSIPASTPGKGWQPPALENIAAELPQYEILGLLGRGGMGAVYKARQKSLNRDVAIKVLPPMEEEDETMRYAERFIAEAQAMGRLEHPNIIAVYDAGQTPGGLLYFVMQYVQGTDVAQMIAASGKLQPEHAYSITAHVCEALAYAHKNGIIHRDIKPANIMVDTEGRVKVADFGLAKAVDAQSGFTQSNMAVGTPDFVAPEALIPGMPVDSRADLYAVGVMLYQMLTGNIPRGAWQPASVVAPGTDPRFDQIIVKAMAFDREQRHDSATELRQHLDTLLMPEVPAPDLQQYNGAQTSKGDKGALVRTQPANPTSHPAHKTNLADKSVRVTSALTQSNKSKTLFFIGIGAVAAVSLGAFIMFSNGEQAKQRTPLALPIGPDVTSTAKSTPSTQRTTSPPVKIIEPTKPQPKSVVVTKEPEPSKTAAPAPNREEPNPIIATPPMSQTVKPLVVTQMPAASKVETPPSEPHSNPTVSPSRSLPPELATLDAQFIILQKERVNTPFEMNLATLNTNYVRGIGKKITDEKAAGNLDGILALEAEQKLIAAKQPVPETDDDKTPASLKALRATYREQLVKLFATRDANLKALTDPLDKHLSQLETNLTKEDRLADAKTVRGYREALGEGIATAPTHHESTSGKATKMVEVEKGIRSPLSPAATLALKDGFTNTLGMKFLPVKGTDVLFCIHETRYRDYAAYAADSPDVDSSWKDQTCDGFKLIENKDNHPVIKVNMEDAQNFCEWLSKKEGKTYRLPTDQEWSYAVGIGHKEKRGQDITPGMLFSKIKEFPWGNEWPPPKNIGNYSDESRKAKAPGNSTFDQYLDNYDDGFPTTAPVMSFKPNKLGLYDTEGNVNEFVEDWWDSTQKNRVLRGGCWTSGGPQPNLFSSYRSPAATTPNADTGLKLTIRSKVSGFRCVLVISRR
jgi:serine/threonine protein kinase/formylglycine-generating enzyme required for sulfatase activity